MIINNVQFLYDSVDIINKLRFDLAAENSEYLTKEPRESGNNIQIQCPYHGNGQERKPSAGIRKSDGIFHCFACGETHSLPEVISYCFNKNDSGAYGWRYLLENIPNQKAVFDSHYKDTKKEEKHIEYVSEEELDSYRWTHPYWAKRGIVDEKIIELFDLGYDKKAKCITFPVRDEQGNCEFVARRSVNTKFFQYPQGVSKPLYGLYEIYHSTIIQGTRKAPSIILCESMIDCILLWQSNHPALALNGLGNERQFQQLRELPVRHIILATDNDEPGKNARTRIRKYVQNKIFSEIKFPKGIKDIGECSKEQIDNILQWETWGWERA